MERRISHNENFSFEVLGVKKSGDTLIVKTLSS